MPDPNRDPECFSTVWTGWTQQFGKPIILDKIAHNGRIGIGFSLLGDFGSKRPRVRIPILRPNKKVHPPGGLSYLDGLRDSKGRHQSADWCKKVSGGHFFSPWENPLVSGRTPCGCGQKPILPLPQAQLLHFNKPCRNTQHLLWMSGVFLYLLITQDISQNASS